MQCTPFPLPSFRRAFETTKPGKSNRYRKSSGINQRHILDEVHLYADLPVVIGNRTVIPIRDIYHVDQFVPDKSATSGSAILGVLGITTGALLTGVMVAAICSSVSFTPQPSSTSSESCPFVYFLDDTGYRFIGEIYSGAIYPSLEREDYLTIADHSSGKEVITLKMTNELQEIQHTNHTELLVFDHPRSRCHDG